VVTRIADIMRTHHTPHTRWSERATDQRRVLRDLKPEIRAGNPGEQRCVRESKLAGLSQAGQRSRGALAHAARRVGSDQIRSVGEILQSEQGGGSTCCTSERASEHQARASIRTVPPSLLNLICVRHNKSPIAAAAAVTRKEAAAALPSSSRGGSSCFLFLNIILSLYLRLDWKPLQPSAFSRSLDHSISSSQRRKALSIVRTACGDSRLTVVLEAISTYAR